MKKLEYTMLSPFSVILSEAKNLRISFRVDPANHPGIAESKMLRSLASLRMTGLVDFFKASESLQCHSACALQRDGQTIAQRNDGGQELFRAVKLPVKFLDGPRLAVIPRRGFCHAP